MANEAVKRIKGYQDKSFADCIIECRLAVLDKPAHSMCSDHDSLYAAMYVTIFYMWTARALIRLCVRTN